MVRIEHINRNLPTAGHTPMYNTHKFFARKQEDVIREYIRAYSQKGEIVLDPFCGSGVHISEALRLGRKAIGIDVNPVAIFVTENTIRHESANRIYSTFNEIKKEIADDINSLYLTRCRQCGKRIPAICFTWKEGKPVDVRYRCPNEKEKAISEIDRGDKILLGKIERGKIPEFFNSKGKCRFYYPTQRLYYDDGTPFLKKERFEGVNDIFTKRNLIALARLNDSVRSIDDVNLRESFKYAFTSMTHLASKMTPVRPSRPFSSAWVQHSYWFCPHNMESNVWSLFESAVRGRQGLIKAKEDTPKSFKELKPAGESSHVNDSSHYYLASRSATDALDELGEDSVHYIITDPPYGKSVQYGELLFMWGAWLGLMDDFNEWIKDEIVENKRQSKSDDDYENMLYVAFRKMYRVLKRGRYCTVTFHNPELKYRNILFRAAIRAGFNFEKIVYQYPPRPSAKGLLQPFGSLAGDYFFRFRKPDIEIGTAGYKSVDERRVESLIVDTTKRIIAERGEPTHYTYIQNAIDPLLYEELRKYGLLMDFKPESVKVILNRHVDSVFQLVDMEIGKKNGKVIMGKGWWFVDPSEHRLDIPLNKRVDEAIVNLLRRKRKVTYTDVCTEVFTRFQNALTPEQETIKSILKENAEEVTGGKWQIKPFVHEIEEKHDEMVYYLGVLGRKCGFSVDIARDEYGRTYDGKQLSASLELAPLKYGDLTKNQRRRAERIDVVWHDGRKVRAEFEVEHSTSIVDAIVRGSNIKGAGIERILVIPNQREDLVSRRFKEPAMKSIMAKTEWKIITYKVLGSFWKQSKSAKEIDPKTFFSLARKPLSSKERDKREQQKLI